MYTNFRESHLVDECLIEEEVASFITDSFSSFV